MTTDGWYSLNVRDETKDLIERIAEAEDMTQADVIHESIGFVFEDFYEPEGPEIRVPEHRVKEFNKNEDKYGEPMDYQL
jgi:hypothetical protein